MNFTDNGIEKSSAYIAIINLVFGIISLSCSLCLITAIGRSMYNARRDGRHEKLIMRPVLYLSLSDVVWSFCLIGGLIPPALGVDDYPYSDNICITVAVVNMFSSVAVTCWSAVIVFMLYLVLMGYPKKIFSERKVQMYQHCFVIMTSSLCAIAPLSLHQYGHVEVYKSECWIMGSTYRLFFFGPIVLNMFFASFTLCIAWFRSFQSLPRRIEPSENKQYKYMRDISVFIICYVLIWILPCIRFLYRISGHLEKTWLDEALEICFSLEGTINFMVWGYILYGRSNVSRTADPIKETDGTQRVKLISAATRDGLDSTTSLKRNSHSSGGLFYSVGLDSDESMPWRKSGGYGRPKLSK